MVLVGSHRKDTVLLFASGEEDTMSGLLNSSPGHPVVLYRHGTPSLSLPLALNIIMNSYELIDSYVWPVTVILLSDVQIVSFRPWQPHKEAS